MLKLCINELAKMVDGRLHLASMPPLAGGLEPVRSVVIDSADAGPGSVYWALNGPGRPGAVLAGDAFARGALGVVVEGRAVEPWAGRFCIVVDDVNASFRLLVQTLQGSWLNGRSPILLDQQHNVAALQAVARGGDRVLEEIVHQRSLANSATSRWDQGDTGSSTVLCHDLRESGTPSPWVG